MTTKSNLGTALFLLLPLLILASSCKDMKLDIQDSKDRLNTLEGSSIPTIGEQISAINTSIDTLKAMDESLNSYIKTLETTAADLQKQINEANAEIAKVEAELGEEITALEQSLLNELNLAKEEIQVELTAINKTIESLKAADAALDQKIADLQTYIDTELASTTDWANATFSTLTQYEQTQTEISGIKASIEQINADIEALETRLNEKIAADIKTAIEALRIKINTDHASRIESAVNNLTIAYTAAVSSAKAEITTAYTNAISNAIIECESGLKAWINTRLTQGYYDIATIEGKLEALSGRFDDTDKYLQKQIDNQKADLEAAKSELTSAYKKAISDAIQTNNGVISEEIAEAVQELEATINSRLSTIESQITAMQKDMDEIIDDIYTIQEQIESINSALGALETEDQGLNSLIDKLESDYAALLQELEEIRPIDDISKKIIVKDIELLKEQVATILSLFDSIVLKKDFVSRIQSLKYIPEYSDSKIKVSDLYKTISIDFLISPSNQALEVKKAWEKNSTVVTGHLRYTKNYDTKVISTDVPLTIVSVNATSYGVLSVKMTEDESYPFNEDFLSGRCSSVVYIQISDGNSDLFSDMIEAVGYLDLSNYKDLSSTESGNYTTSNCYIINSAGAYKFKAFKGNSHSLVGSASNIDPMGTIYSADILWESYGSNIKPKAGDLIQSIGVFDDYIYFNTSSNFKEGNAVLCIKDMYSRILWSWHIWMTDQPEEHIYNNGIVMMDRNLGAVDPLPNDTKTLGLLYQWGRKDPFLAKGVESSISWPDEKKSNASIGTISFATSNPTTFITDNGGLYRKNHDWYYTGAYEIEHNRWTSMKTIYDPCPYGWRIPDGGDIGVLENAYSSSNYDETNKGYYLNLNSLSRTWYPVGTYCTVSTDNYNEVYAIDFSTSDIYHSTSGNAVDKRFVRCIKD